MKKTLLEVYSLLICVMATISIALSTAILAWNTVKLIDPSFTIDSHDFTCHQNDLEYKECLSKSSFYNEDKYHHPLPSGEELSLQRTTSYQTLLLAEHRAAQQNLILTGINLLISIIVFVVHWMMSTRARRPH